MLSGLLILYAVVASALAPLNSNDCSSLAKTAQLPGYNTTFVNATYYSTGSKKIDSAVNEVPFCEIYSRVDYGTNDSLYFTLWLPDKSTYQDRFLAVGNGGMAGVIDYAGMFTQLNNGHGLAIAGGDGGHRADENAGAAPGVYVPYLHDRDQVTAWIHDGISLFTPATKTLIELYYDKPPAYSYYYGCSTGGAQGFALAQFHPELFDAIYAGCPGNWYSHLTLSFLWNAQHSQPESFNLTQAELNFTTNAVLDACDELDGVEDRLLENPLACKFDINTLACNSLSNSTSTNGTITCLQPDKIAAVKSIYSGPKRSDTGKAIYPGFSFGSEIEWSQQQGSLSRDFSIPILQNLVADSTSYNTSTFDWASDVDTLDEKAGTLIDSISPNLTVFRDRGGKLITSQGWADPYNAATWPTEHLEQVEEFFGGDVRDWYKLFMIPGGGHCGSAEHYPGVPATYYVVEEMIKWVEEGKVPKEVESANPPDGSGRTRKLCFWPEIARFVGGNVNGSESYACQ